VGRMLFGSIHPMKLANIRNRNRNTDKLIRALNALNILLEPSLPPLSIPITAEPKLKKINIMIAITTKFMLFSD
jgi:hypothetical protein